MLVFCLVFVRWRHQHGRRVAAGRALPAAGAVGKHGLRCGMILLS